VDSKISDRFDELSVDEILEIEGGIFVAVAAATTVGANSRPLLTPVPAFTANLTNPLRTVTPGYFRW